MENNLRKILLVFSVFLLIDFTYGKLPKSISVCSKNDPKLNQCIIDSIKKVQPFLATGKLDDEFQLAPLEPFKYDGFSFNPSSNFNVKVTNVSMYGSSNFTIEKLRFNITTLVTEMFYTFPKISLIGKYDLKAKIAILDITGNGDLESICYNTRMKLKSFSKKIDGKMLVDKVNVKIIPGSSTSKLSNLFNGDPLLQDIGNKLINENQDIFLEYTIPIMEKQFGKIFKTFSNEIIKNATFDELFPDSTNIE